jgi:hypothetical protein
MMLGIHHVRHSIESKRLGIDKVSVTSTDVLKHCQRRRAEQRNVSGEVCIDVES